MKITEKYRSNYTIAIKIILSVFVLFHIAVILVMPIGSSYLNRISHAFLSPYANSLGLNTTWNFYSPDPAHTMYFNYHVRFEDEYGQEAKPTIDDWFPPEKHQIIVDSSRRRFLYSVRYLLLDPKRLDVLFAPWLCRKYPGATHLSIRQITERIPNLDSAKKNSIVEREIFESDPFEYKCLEKQDEVSL